MHTLTTLFLYVAQENFSSLSAGQASQKIGHSCMLVNIFNLWKQQDTLIWYLEWISDTNNSEGTPIDKRQIKKTDVIGSSEEQD